MTSCTVLLISLLAGLTVASASVSSPVQKVVELLDECKAKIEGDLAEESKAFEEFASYCDDEVSDRTNAIKVATRSIEDLVATIADEAATISNREDEITQLGTLISSKEKELYDATSVRDAGHADFLAAEGELVKSIDELSGAVVMLKKGLSLSQVDGAKVSKKVEQVADVLGKLIETQALDTGSRGQLKAFLQSTQKAAEAEDEEYSLTQPQPKVAGYESSSGGILETVQAMESKAEDTLGEVRKKEMVDSNSFSLVKAGIEDEISHGQGKLSTATAGKAAAQEGKAKAEGNLEETQKTKAADEKYMGTLKMECQHKAKDWEERQRSATGELGAIAEATEILVGGVKVFVQVAVKTKFVRKMVKGDGDAESDRAQAQRQQLVDKLRQLGQDHKSFALSQLANMAASDPFGKVRGLIEGMISKLQKKAQEDATHEAFCQEEIGKSTASRDEKTAKQEKYQSRIDSAQSSMDELAQAIAELTSEVAEIDKATAEATKIRNEEHADYVKSSRDFRESAAAVAKAIEVLKNYYEGAALLQVSSHMAAHVRQPQSDTAHTIIAVLEMSEQDFAQLLAEVEASEDEADRSYKAVSQENRVSRASKATDGKGKESEVKSLKVALFHSKEDHGAISEELNAVIAYLNKLKPQCETKAMSYGERKAAREAEIDGLKEALTILEESASLVQISRRNLRARA